MGPSSEVGLAVLATIRKYTDEEHILSLDQVASIIFEDYGIPVDPKSLTRYVKLIHKYGFEIDAYIYQKREVYVKNISFLAEEAYIICFSLLHNVFLSESRKRSLIKKIYGKLNVHQQSEFMSRFEGSEDRRLIEPFLAADPAETKPENYIGKKRKMRSGKTATIVGYRNENDIDVKIGTDVLLHKSMSMFEKGQLRPLSHSPRTLAVQRIGMTNVMNNGEKATIIDYITNRDISIQFEDGTIVHQKDFRSFEAGKIRNPNKHSFKEQYIGLEKRMNNGQLATIIEYRTSNDVDVLFEDGTVVYHKSVHKFQQGIIRNPSINRYQKRVIGLKKIMNTGEEAEIVEYKNINDITVKFEDGTVIHKRKYNDFLDGKIIPYKSFIDYQSERLNETRLMSNGQMATIISYKSAKDIDVKFDDGTVVKKKSYYAFLQGHITNPNKLIRDYRSERINETRVMCNGQKATIISYKGSDNIDVKFEDDTIVKKKRYYAFLQGHITNPNKLIRDYRSERINETKLMHNGQMATIISYKNSDNIDVKFEDGTIVKKRLYKDFQKGHIQNPNKTIIKHQSERLNETRLMHNGQMATIISYKSANNIDVKFEDGTIVKKRTYLRFQKGSIQNPNKKQIKQI